LWALEILVFLSGGRPKARKGSLFLKKKGCGVCP